MDEPDNRARWQRRMRPPKKQRKTPRPSAASFDQPMVGAPIYRHGVAGDVLLSPEVPLPPSMRLSEHIWEYRPDEVRATVPEYMRPPLPERLPARIRCVLARDEPGPLLHDLAALRDHVHCLARDLRHGTTYHVQRELDAARERTRELSRYAKQIARHLRTGPCPKLRQREQYAGYVSVRDRGQLDDGGLQTVGTSLAALGDALGRLRSRAPWYVRVRDADLSSTRDRIGTYTGHLIGLIDTITVDLTAADLSRAGLTPAVPLNVLWTTSTIWTRSVAPTIRKGSVEVSRGVLHYVANRQ